MTTPSAAARLAVPPGSAAPEAQAAAPRLLIVDDIADNRTILARRFERKGYAITEADGGQRALDLIEQGSFDLVLLDVMMPEMDGLEVLRRIRERHSPVALPVIMVTAKSQSEDVVEALGLGANDYVTKPVDFAVALARANTQVGRKRAEEGVRQANEALQQANDDLERRVAERTAKLVSANEQLQLEMAHRQKSEARVEYLAHHDPLTGLGNRVLFAEQVSEALARGRRQGESLAVLVLGLDGFKNVNDTLGHAIGDACSTPSPTGCARALARRPARPPRRGRVRHPADLERATEQRRELGSAAHRRARPGPIVVDGHDIVVGASLGIAIAADADTDTEQLLKSADLAMYRAKADGRGRFRFFEPDMDARAQARRSSSSICAALSCTASFELHYQPLFNLKTKPVIGFEALMRWRHAGAWAGFSRRFHPPRRRHRPDRPDRRMGAAAGLRARRPPGPMTFSDRGEPVAEPVQERRASSRRWSAPRRIRACRPNRLELEITEVGRCSRRRDDNLSILKQLRAPRRPHRDGRFRHRLFEPELSAELPFDKVKIDQSFIRDMSEGDDSRAIVRAVAALGVSFGMTTTAEGVETEQQMQCLRVEGLDEIQGYLISRPVPGSDIPALLARIKSGAFAPSSAGSAKSG